MPLLLIFGGVCDNSDVRISAAIITFNEEANIADALELVRWADEVLVVDSESSDRTREIAERAGARVIVQPWLGFSGQKQFATDNAANDWVLSLDADERISEVLREEIMRLKDSEPVADGYTIPRLSIYMGREIRHGGWYPDRQLRLFDRRKGKWNDRVVHESFQLAENARSGELRSDILHYSVKNAEHHARMIAERYAPLAAQQMRREGRRTNWVKIIFTGWLAFIRTYFLKLGFLDGFPGFCIAYFAAHHAFLKHLMLLEIQNNRKNQPED